MADAIGIAFPFRPDPTGFPKKEEDVDLIESAVKQVILTNTGERLMRPTLGCPLQSYIFENIDQITIEAIRAVVQDAIVRNVEDVALLDVDVTADPDASLSVEPNKVTIFIAFERFGRKYQLSVPVGG